MKLSSKMKSLFDFLNNSFPSGDWISIWDLENPPNMNTVYALLTRELIQIRWVGERNDRKPLIRLSKKG